MGNWARGIVLVVGVAGCSPYGGGAFTCSMDTQCGAGAKCMNSLCAFPDGMCSSGFRYGDLAGASSNTCVAGPDIDGGIDSPMTIDSRPIDSPPGQSCYGQGPGKACFAQPPTGTQTLTAAIDTDGAMCSAAVLGTSPGCVIAADSLTVGGTVTVTGSKPLVLVAVTTLDVTGTLDASSHRAPAIQIGASADFAGCDAGTAPGMNGGGAGGSFGTIGGNGGNDDAAMHAGTAGAAQPTLTSLRGGCPGQPGSAGGGTAGAAGHGGGVLYLIAGTSITITAGTINASGETGTGGALQGAGGGGAGAGGLIAFDSPSVTNAGVIFANGGGGGEGAGTNSTGRTATDPTATTTTGGAGGTNAGGDGGAGAVNATAATNGSNGAPTGAATGGGGGGGGGAGLIKLYQAATIGGAGTVSPPAS